jgi:peroxiredoxin Q/BCP
MAYQRLNPGDTAPDFTLKSEKEEPVALKALVELGPVMIAFYPRDFSPVCTKQLCGYQEALDRFVKYGVNIVAISPNDPEKHAEFKRAYGFAFPLLSDPDKSVFKSYGVTSLFMLGGASRAVFVIARGGKVVYRYVEPTVLTHRKPDELLLALDELKRAGQI